MKVGCWHKGSMTTSTRRSSTLKMKIKDEDKNHASKCKSGKVLVSNLDYKFGHVHVHVHTRTVYVVLCTRSIKVLACSIIHRQKVLASTLLRMTTHLALVCGDLTVMTGTGLPHTLRTVKPLNR